MKSVSVVVPAFNATSTLASCLTSLLSNDYPTFEVMVVDDGSEDDSLVIARRVGEGAPNMQVIAAEHGGPAHARNLGIRASTGELVLFTDSDVLAPTDWISNICRQFRLRDVAAVGGSVRPLCLSNRYEEAEHYRYQRLIGDEPRYIGALPTCNLAVKRSVLDEVGLFDEDFKLPASEDYDLCYRINDSGHRIWFAPECAVNHMHPTSLGPIVRRGFIQGKEGARLALKRHGNDNNWSSAGPLHCLQSPGVLRAWLLRHLPSIPGEYRWIIACFDLSFSLGWFYTTARSDGLYGQLQRRIGDRPAK